MYKNCTYVHCLNDNIYIYNQQQRLSMRKTFVGGKTSIFLKKTQQFI